MNTILAKMAVQIVANTAEFNKGLNSASSNLKNFTGDVKSMAAAMAAAFSIREVGQFVLEMNKLAGTFEGVQRAFERLPNSALLMDNLKQSTHGTVDELMLMQQALRARNFGISVKDLGTYLEFAAIRAQQTGESIDYMVNSIILGLGRGSIKILDNLQVNIAKIKETVKETGVSLQEAFRQQVIDQMGKIGGFAETSATKVQELEAAFKALRLQVAKKLESGGLIDSITDAVDAMRVFFKAGGDPGKMKLVLQLEEIDKQAVKIAKRTTENLKGSLQEQQDAVQQSINTLTQLIGKRNDELIKVNEEIAKTPLGHSQLDKRLGLFDQKGSMKADIEEMKGAMKILKEFLQTMQDGTAGVGKEIGIIAKLRQEIENEETIMEAALSEKEIGESREALKKLNEELDRLLGKQKKAKGALKLEIIVDEFQGSTFDDAQNVTAANNAKEFSNELMAIGTSAEFAGGALIKLSTEVVPVFKKAVGEMVDISGLLVNGIVSIADAFGQAAVTGAKDFGKNFLQSMGNFAQQFGGMLIAIGVGEKALKLGGPGAKIAAGVALVALGGAVKALLNKPPSLSGGGAGGSSGFTRPRANENFQNLSFSTSVSGTEFNIVLGNQSIRDSYTKPKWRK